jgi:hypothetical protein
MHGIQRERRWDQGPGNDDGVARILVRYGDGRLLEFIPDARRPTFSEDDILELKKAFDKASSNAEWAELDADPSRRA